MKKISLLLLLVPILLVGGCNYHELNDIYLVSALSVDYDSEYKVSLLTVSDNEESPTRFIEGHGKSLEKTFYHINNNYNKPLYLGHLNLIIISEEASKKGIKPLLDIINEDNETKKNFYLVLAKNTKAIDVLQTLSKEKLETKETEGVHRYLSLENIHNQVTYNTYTKEMKENHVSLITSYELKEEQLQTSSLGVFQNHKFKTWLKDTDGTLLLNGMLNEYVLNVEKEEVLLKNIKVKREHKKSEPKQIEFHVTATIKESSVSEEKIKQALHDLLMEATYESIYQTHLDYFHFKPWFYKHNRIKIKNLNEVEPKINITIQH